MTQQGRGGCSPEARVLIIDDDITMSSLLRTLLELEGYTVLESREWDDLAKSIISQSPDVVIMDYILPGVEGLEVLSDLNSQNRENHFRIIMTSGMNVEEECLEAGANSFILKPYAPDALLIKVCEELNAVRENDPPASEEKR